MQKKLVSVGIALVSILAPLPVQAANFLNEITGIYAFGDSLTDTGNLYSAIGQPPPPYFPGRISNGYNWLDYLSQGLGLSSPTPFFSGLPANDGFNFAFTGATSGLANVLDAPFFPGLQQQIGTFVAPLQAGNQLADPDALYILWAGGNDYLPTDSLTFTPIKQAEPAIANLTAAIAALASVGAKNILTVNLPDLGSTPRILGRDPSFALSPDDPTPGELTALVNAHNTQLSSALTALDKSLAPDVNLMTYDVYSLFDSVLSNPSSFGFTNKTDPCLFVATCVFDPTGQTQQQYVFWDGIHPTTKAHEIIAQGALTALRQQQSIPEPSATVALVALGCLAIATARTRTQN